MKKTLIVLFSLIGLAYSQANYYSPIRFRNDVYMDKLYPSLEAQNALVIDYKGQVQTLDLNEIGKIDSGEVIGDRTVYQKP